MTRGLRSFVFACAIWGTSGPAILESAQPLPEQILALQEEVRALAARGQHRDALDRLERAQRLADPRSGPAALASIELLRAVSLRAIGDRHEAQRAGERAHRLALRAGDQALIIDSLIQTAVLLSESGRTPDAARLAEDALTRAESAGDEKRLAAVFDALSRYRREQGRSAEAVDFGSRAIAIADRTNDVDFSVRARGSRATALLALGRFDEALADGERAYELARGRTATLEASSAFSLAQAHAHVWNLDRAAELWDAAIAAYRRAGLQIGVALSLRQRVDTMYALGELDSAARDGEAALAMLEPTVTPYTPGLLARLALIEARRGRPDAARQYAARAANLGTDQVSPRFVHNDLGLVSLLANVPVAAEAHFNVVLAAAKSMADPEYEWRARYGLGRASLLRGDPAAALRELCEAVAIIERMRRTLPDAGLRASFLSDRTIAHEALIEALAAQSNQPDDAFARRALDVAELARGRGLADLLAEADRLPGDPILQAVRATEMAFARRLSDVQRRLAKPLSESARKAAMTELHAAERDFETLVVRLRREQPAYAALRYPNPLPADRISAMLADDEALISFVTGERAGFGWIVRRSGSALFRTPARGALDSAVRLMNAVIASGDGDAVQASGRRLEELLFGPARARLEGIRRLIIVPDGPLHRLSFAALRTPADRWLIEDVAIAFAPSATVLGELRARQVSREARPMTAFAATASIQLPALLPTAGRSDGRPLVHTEAEVQDAARALGIAPPVPARTEAAVKAMSGDAVRVVHFAAHAVANEATPRRSGILLEPDDREDGWLQVHEIPHLTTNADLVVLATCRSQAGRWLRGEGLLGLSRAFMRAGARAVVATLWEVDDAETRRVMRSFYEGLAGGLRPDAALARAQRTMLDRGGRSADPRAWSAFVVTGDVSAALFSPPPSTSRATALMLLAAIAVAAALWRRRAAIRRSAPPEAAGR